MPLVHIDARQIHDWKSFHDVFARVFGFPEFYGRNMNAWIDCMTYLDEDTGMTTVHGSASDTVVLCVNHINAMPPEIYAAMVECAAFVNWRRIEMGLPSVLTLAFHKAAKL
jgi:hypothetical protein